MCELMLSDAQTAQYCHSELGNTLLSAHVTIGEYIACYITSLFQRVIVLHNSLIANYVAG